MKAKQYLLFGAGSHHKQLLSCEQVTSLYSPMNESPVLNADREQKLKQNRTFYSPPTTSTAPIVWRINILLPANKSLRFQTLTEDKTQTEPFHPSRQIPVFLSCVQVTALYSPIKESRVLNTRRGQNNAPKY